jgi:hypothetical protein
VERASNLIEFSCDIPQLLKAAFTQLSLDRHRQLAQSATAISVPHGTAD